MESEKLKKAVREGYGKIARSGSSCCSPEVRCESEVSPDREISRRIGYSEEEINAVPEGANLGLGCGNPVAFASLREGETVLDVGSGAGFDSFLAARKVGPGGRVTGVDMTPEMLERAREKAEKGGYRNVEFRLGEIENLPVADNSVDIIISNCVINLSIDKRRVFKEAFRVLKPGGRLMISDIVLLKPLPGAIRKSVEACVGCISGAMLKEEYISTIMDAGFEKIEIVDETTFPVDLMANDPTAQAIIQDTGITSEMIRDVEKSVLSIKISGEKP